MDRNIYLDTVDLEEAVELFNNRVKTNRKFETIHVKDALGRTTSDVIFAKVSSPYYNASAMDGIAVEYEKCTEAKENNILTLNLDSDYLVVNTGNVIKEPFNAVIMIENVFNQTANTVQIDKAPTLWQHVRFIGEDIVQGELILPSGHTIRPVDMGALLAGGITHIKVVKKPVVTIIPTGTEIISCDEKIEIGKIIDSNSTMFSAMAVEVGAAPTIIPPLKDDYELICKTVEQSVETSDLIIIGAGSSAGTEDYTRSIIERLGEVVIHGVAIKPGKPVVLGFIKDTPVVGIPGYPVSAYFVFTYFVLPVLSEMANKKQEKKSTIKGMLLNRVLSSLKHLEFVRVKLGKVGENLVVTPLKRGAGVTMSLVEGDGILKIPKTVEGYEKGELVEIELSRDISDIENTLVAVGSHDVLIDVMNNLLHRSLGNLNLSSSHVGSMGGLIAFKNNQCHISPIHLLDEKTGEYNISFVEKYIKEKCYLIKGVKRVQGIITQKDNPKNIMSLIDLERHDISFVNRQKGSGTRLLVDFLFEKNRIDPDNVIGYDNEQNTHMMTASAVAGGTVDATVGVMSAANNFDLNFIPIGEESYDFLIREDIINTTLGQEFIACLKSDEFKLSLEKLGGYLLNDCAKIIEIN